MVESRKSGEPGLRRCLARGGGCGCVGGQALREKAAFFREVADEAAIAAADVNGEAALDAGRRTGFVAGEGEGGRCECRTGSGQCCDAEKG